MVKLVDFIQTDVGLIEETPKIEATNLEQEIQKISCGYVYLKSFENIFMWAIFMI